MRRPGPSFVLPLLGLLLAGGAFAAEPPPDDLGAPGPEHRRLDALVGEWDVTVSFPTAPGQRREGSATASGRWVLDGRFVRLEYASTFAGRPLTIVRYLGYDRHRGRWVEIQFESTPIVIDTVHRNMAAQPPSAPIE